MTDSQVAGLMVKTRNLIWKYAVINIKQFFVHLPLENDPNATAGVECSLVCSSILIMVVQTHARVAIIPCHT